LFVAAVTAVLWWKLRRGWLITTMVAVVVLAVGLIVFEQLSVTDNEQLRWQVRQMARAVQRNDVEGLLGHIHPRSVAYATARTEMPQYTFRRCHVTGVRRVAIEADSDPPRAQVEFIVYVSVDATRSPYNYDGHVYRKVMLDMEKQADGRWLMTHYFHTEPQAPSSRQERLKLGESHGGRPRHAVWPKVWATVWAHRPLTAALLFP
jgi:hypothetical protein